MKDAKSLLLEVLAAIPDGEKIAPLFAEDGVAELPFLHSVGIEPRKQAFVGEQPIERRPLDEPEVAIIAIIATEAN
jgi:hypothetical protein